MHNITEDLKKPFKKIMSKTRKIGFLGGTFDPFHLGHLNLAVEMIDKGYVDEVLVCPTSISPFKLDNPPIAIFHRVQMIKAAIEGVSKLSLIDLEIQSNEPAYTYNTLCTLKEKFKSQDKELYLILSDDLLLHLDQWYQIKNLIDEFTLLIGERSREGISVSKIAPWIYEKVKNNFVKIRCMEMSSREIRLRLKNKLYCGHLLPLKTLDYIYKYKLYS